MVPVTQTRVRKDSLEKKTMLLTASCTKKELPNMLGCETCEAWIYGSPDSVLPCDQCLRDEKEITDRYIRS